VYTPPKFTQRPTPASNGGSTASLTSSSSSSSGSKTDLKLESSKPASSSSRKTNETERQRTNQLEERLSQASIAANGTGTPSFRKGSMSYLCFDNSASSSENSSPDSPTSSTAPLTPSSESSSTSSSASSSADKPPAVEKQQSGTFVPPPLNRTEDNRIVLLNINIKKQGRQVLPQAARAPSPLRTRSARNAWRPVSARSASGPCSRPPDTIIHLSR